jgi:hypothetical protein
MEIYSCQPRRQPGRLVDGDMLHVIATPFEKIEVGNIALK